MAGIGGEVFGEDKKKATGGAGPRAPEKGGVAGKFNVFTVIIYEYNSELFMFARTITVIVTV